MDRFLSKTEEGKYDLQKVHAALKIGILQANQIGELVIKEYLPSIISPQALRRDDESEGEEEVGPNIDARLEDTIRTSIKEADEHAALGGDSLDPRIVTVSFPGNMRGYLFAAFKHLNLALGEEGDVHAMNDNSVAEQMEAVDLPEEWGAKFGKLKAWKQLIQHLSTIDVGSRSYIYIENKAPVWFVKHWGLAAWNTAHRTSTTGSGIIILCYRAYACSKWCKLEWLFCQCLAQCFPRSVFVGFHFSSHKSWYMKGDEPFPAASSNFCCTLS